MDKLFSDSRSLHIINIQEGIKTFHISKYTCLQTDWGKDEIGYLLLQQHCFCPLTTVVKSCPEGWRLVFTCSRFTTEAESQYAPSESKCLAIIWSLNNARIFILECKVLILITDHKFQLGILNSRETNSFPTQDYDP